MLELKNTEGKYIVAGYTARGLSCGYYSVEGDLEEAIATAQVEWCEGQDTATIYALESMAVVAEGDASGRFRLMPWGMEIVF